MATLTTSLVHSGLITVSSVVFRDVMQKIASNYVCGFIILLDKSIHIGDILMVGEHYGVVTLIRSRYTVLRKLDGIEVIIPNETLISENIINHTDLINGQTINHSDDCSHDLNQQCTHTNNHCSHDQLEEQSEEQLTKEYEPLRPSDFGFEAHYDSE